MTGGAAQRGAGLLVVILLFQLFAFGLWIGGPRLEVGERCMFNVQLGAHIGHSINCDSSEFLYAAADPEQILGPEGKRQSRPGSVLLTWLLARPLVVALDVLAPDGGKGISFKDKEQGDGVAFTIPRNELVAAYGAFLLQHILILVLCFRLYTRLARGGGTGPLPTVVAVAGIMVLVNNITKQFLWSPHTQLFNILVPLAGMFLFKKMQDTDRPERLFLTGAVLCGIGMLFYGLAVLAAVLMGLGYVWRRREEMQRSLNPWLTGVASVAVFAVPYGIWYGFIVLRNGEFYNYDVTLFKGFVWLNEAYAAQGLAAATGLLIGKFISMFTGALAQGWGYVLLLAGLVFYARRNGLKGDGALWTGAGIYILLAAAFYAWYGLTVERLSFTLVVPLFALIGSYLMRTGKESLTPLHRVLVIFAAFAYTVFMIVKFGPYS